MQFVHIDKNSFQQNKYMAQNEKDMQKFHNMMDAFDVSIQNL